LRRVTTTRGATSSVPSPPSFTPHGTDLLLIYPLDPLVQELEPAAAKLGSVLTEVADAARELLAEPQEVTTLHGDLHHGNVLDFGARGWLAIDPKRLVDERAFDLANIFCNPDLGTATAMGRLVRQSSVVAEAAGLERRRLLKWILAYGGLSEAWHIADDENATLDLRIAELAAAELRK
jgi:streptomycin 6-kinase